MVDLEKSSPKMENKSKTEDLNLRKKLWKSKFQHESKKERISNILEEEMKESEERMREIFISKFISSKIVNIVEKEMIYIQKPKSPFSILFLEEKWK